MNSDSKDSSTKFNYESVSDTYSKQNSKNRNCMQLRSISSRSPNLSIDLEKIKDLLSSKKLKKEDNSEVCEPTRLHYTLFGGKGDETLCKKINKILDNKYNDLQNNENNYIFIIVGSIMVFIILLLIALICLNLSCNN